MGTQGEAGEETKNNNKINGESPRGTTLPVILFLVSKLEASHFFNLKPDIYLSLQFYVDMDNRSHSCLKGAKLLSWFQLE